MEGNLSSPLYTCVSVIAFSVKKTDLQLENNSLLLGIMSRIVRENDCECCHIVDRREASHIHTMSVFIPSGGGIGSSDPLNSKLLGVGAPPPPQIWTKNCPLYQCAININTGLNIALEFTFGGLIFEKYPGAKGFNPLVHFPPVWWQAKRAAVADLPCFGPAPLTNSWNKPCIWVKHLRNVMVFI